jgi:hypothetical protein
MRHYWRGVFDGDGTIVKHPDREAKWHLRLLGSEASMEAFRIWTAAVTGTTAKKYPKGNIWSFTVGGLASPQSLAREMYDGAAVYLDRKHELAFQLMAAPIRRRSPARLRKGASWLPRTSPSMCSLGSRQDWPGTSSRL